MKRFLSTPVRRMVAGSYLLAVVVLAGAFVSFDGMYLVNQGLGFLRTLAQARDIATLRRAQTLDPATLGFFDRLDDIRSFAREEVGLTINDSFSRYVATNQSYLVNVVSGVRDDSFERKTWQYPLVGSLFYRGFYDTASAQREAARLQRAGFDVHVRPVRAFSSLGFFPDPAFTYMRGYGEYELANLILHEQMHATVWASGRNQFNEEIATFVGDVGAEQYVVHKYGVDSEEYRSIHRLKADKETFRGTIRSIHADLQTAYDSLTARDARLSAKAAIFSEAQREFSQNYDELFLTDRYRGFANAALNNAYIDSYMKYRGDLSIYYRLLRRYDGDLSAVIDVLRVAATAEDDPRSYIASLVNAVPE
ncbi:MAG: aminopeptidase [Spirochaetia bacterium]